MRLFLLIGISALAAIPLQGALIGVTPGPFDPEFSQDFNGLPTGPLSPSVLADLRIEQIEFSVSAPGPSDVFDVRPGATRSLGANGSELLILDPGEDIGPLAFFYRIKFVFGMNGIAFTLVDQGLSSPVDIVFSDSGGSIDSFSFTPSTSGPENISLLTSFRFTEVTISQNTGTGLGFVFDDLALIPEPGSAALMTISLLALFRRSRSRERNRN